MEKQLLLDEQLCFAVYKAGKAFTKLYSQSLKPFNLTYPQYLVLLVLWETDQQSVLAIGKRLGLDSGTLTPLLKRMEKLDFVTRQRQAVDERYLTISLTAKAKLLKMEIVEAVQINHQQIDCSADQKQHLLTELKELTQKIQGGITNGKII